MAKEPEPCIDGIWVYKNYAGRITEVTKIIEDTAEVYICNIPYYGAAKETFYQGVKPQPHIVAITTDDKIHYIHDNDDDIIHQFHEFEFGVVSDILTRATIQEQYSVYLKGCYFEKDYLRYGLWDEL